MTNKPVGILLAAGGSRRLGQPKQLVKYQGKTLIQHAAQSFLKAFPDSELVVILGSKNAEIQSTIANLKTTVLVNNHWEEGLSSSLKIGTEYLKKNSQKSFLIFSCDQFLLTSQHLLDLFKKYSQTKTASFTDYENNSWGIPCCISHSLLMKSSKLQRDEGIKKLLINKNDISLVKNKNLSLDLDTPEDLHRLNSLH